MVIEAAVQDVDEMIDGLRGQHLVLASEVIDKLLDIRSTLTPLTDEDVAAIMQDEVAPN